MTGTPRTGEQQMTARRTSPLPTHPPLPPPPSPRHPAFWEALFPEAGKIRTQKRVWDYSFPEAEGLPGSWGRERIHCQTASICGARAASGPLLSTTTLAVANRASRVA